MNTKKKWRVRVAVWATYGGKFQAYVDATQNGREVAGFYGEPRPTALAAKRDGAKVVEAVKAYAALRNAVVAEVVYD